MEDMITLPKSALVKLMHTYIKFPNSHMCRHHAVIELLTMLEMQGLKLNPEFVAAIFETEDEKAIDTSPFL